MGHSTRAVADFIDLISSHGVEAVVDVRRFPASRRYPHFNRVELEAELARHAIGYTWLESLGGRRPPLPESHNTAWRNAAFRGYADYMSSAEFENGIRQLEEIAVAARAAIMCSEAVWWRCHRSLIADYLRSRSVEVLHILDAGAPTAHPWTAAARLLDGRLTYEADCGDPARLQPPGAQPSLL